MPTLDELLAQVDAARDDIIKLEQDLVRIPSVNTGFMPTGNETAVCEYIRDWLAAEGVDSETLESAPGRGNIIASLKGRSSNAGLMFMAHLDVVPVEDEAKWTYPPFSATIANGRIYGRGASDCKALLTAQLMASRILLRNSVELKDNLLLSFSADEESGGRYGVGWLAEHHPEKITAPYAVNEGGGQPADAAGNLAYIINLGEKGRVQIEIEVKGESAHASVPWRGTNALYRAAQVLERIESYEPERDTSAEIFRHLSKFAIEEVPSPENIDSIVDELEARDPAMATTLRALSRMTLAATVIQGGIKANSVPETVNITCDSRILPHQDDEYVRGELTRLLDGIPGVSIDLDYTAISNASSADTEFMTHIQNVTEYILGGRSIEWVPGLCVGVTDSRFTRPLGVVTYGFDGSDPDDNPLEAHIHATNESVSIRTLVTSTKVMLALAYEMLAVR